MYRIFLIIIIGLVFLDKFLPEDPAWVDCSNEKDLYKYVVSGWKVDGVLKKGDIKYSNKGQKMYYLGEEPQIYLSKNDRIKVLNFGWRCWFEETSELNYKKN